MTAHGYACLAAQEAAEKIGDLIAQSAQEMAQQLVDLEAVAAASLHDDLLIQRLFFKKDGFLQQDIEVFVGHGAQMRRLNALKILFRRSEILKNADSFKICLTVHPRRLQS